MVRTDTALAAPEATHTTTVAALESTFATSPVPTAISATLELESIAGCVLPEAIIANAAAVQ